MREWLGIDGIAGVAKDSTVYPDFAGVRPAMDAESVSFITEVIDPSRSFECGLFGGSFFGMVGRVGIG